MVLCYKLQASKRQRGVSVGGESESEGEAASGQAAVGEPGQAATAGQAGATGQAGAMHLSRLVARRTCPKPGGREKGGLLQRSQHKKGTMT